MVWAVILSVLLACYTPHLAIAEDIPDSGGYVVEPIRESTNNDDVVGAIDRLRNDLLVGQDLQNLKIDKLIEQTQPEQTETINDMNELDYLASIDAKLDGLAPEVLEIEQQEARAAVSVNTFNAYANVSPTSAYASYAKGLLPRVGFGEHYCFLQDTNSSYVFIWGALANGSMITGTDVKWVRWYYVNNTSGYVEEYGGGDVTINPSNHVILTDLGDRPMLDSSIELLRREVGFYAVVTVVLFSLVAVWGFVVRLRGSVTMQG